MQLLFEFVTNQWRNQDKAQEILKDQLASDWMKKEDVRFKKIKKRFKTRFLKFARRRGKRYKKYPKLETFSFSSIPGSEFFASLCGNGFSNLVITTNSSRLSSRMSQTDANWIYGRMHVR